MKVKQEILFTLALFPLELLMSNNKQKPKQSPVKVKAPSNYVGVPRKVRNYFLLEIYEDQKNSEWNSHQREREVIEWANQKTSGRCSSKMGFLIYSGVLIYSGFF